MKKNQKVSGIMVNFADKVPNSQNYRKIKIPAASVLLEEYDIDKMQIRFGE